MDLKTVLESLFDTDITDMCEVGDLDDTQESPALVACEAARGVLETFDEEPEWIAEMADGFLVSGGRSAILVGNDGSVVAKSLDDDEDDDDADLLDDEDDEDDPDEATTSATVGGFRGGAGTPMMGKYGRKNAKKKGGLKLEDVEEDDREELFEELVSEHVRLQTDYGTVSLRVDPYNVLRYPTDDKMDMDERDAMRSKVDDSLLKAVLAAKPAFESALKKALKADEHIRKYGIKIKEDLNEDVLVVDLMEGTVLEIAATVLRNRLIDSIKKYAKLSEKEGNAGMVGPGVMSAVLQGLPAKYHRGLASVLKTEMREGEDVHMFLLQEFAEQLVVNATEVGILDDARDLLPVLDEAIADNDVVRAEDTLKQICEAFGVDEKLIPVPSPGKNPNPPVSANPYGSKGRHGRVAQLKGGRGKQFSMEDIEDLGEDEIFEAGMSFLGGKASGGPMLGTLHDDPDKLKTMMTALHQRRLELLGQTGGTLPAMKMEHHDGTWYIEGLWQTNDDTEAATAAQALDIDIVKAPEGSPDNGDGSGIYEFKFPRARIKEFVSLAAKGGAESDAQIAVDGDGFRAYLPESVAIKVRPFFKGDGVEINEVAESASEPVLAG